MIKAILIDDEITPKETLRIMLEMYAPEIKIVGEADGVKSGIQAIHKYKPELLFLDIQMGDGTGFDLLSYFPNEDFKVIFVTAFEEYALKAFKFSALDYLVKPVTPDDLINSIKKIPSTFNQSDLKKQLKVFEENYNKSDQSFGKIILKTMEAIYIVDINDIIHCESENNYTNFIFSNTNNLLVSRTLKEYDEMLEEVGFLRVHRSHLVNTKHIDYFDKRDGGMLVMKNGNKIPVSYRKKNQLIQCIQELGRRF